MTMCCIYDLVYSLETHIKHLHLEDIYIYILYIGYKRQLYRPRQGEEQPLPKEVSVLINAHDLKAWVLLSDLGDIC